MKSKNNLIVAFDTHQTRNVFAWKVRNLNLAILTVYSLACVTLTFDIFGNFKINVRAFQCVYKGLKLIIKALRDYLMMKKRDCFSNKQDSFLKAVFMHDRICHALGWFWQVLNVEEREKLNLESQSCHLSSIYLLL